jgi:CHAT domain-containing protein
MKNFEKGIEFQKKSVSHLKKNGGEKSEQFKDGSYKLGLMLIDGDKIDEAEVILQNSVNILNTDLKEKQFFMSEVEKELYNKMQTPYYSIYNSVALKFLKPKFISTVYNNELFLKSQLLNSTISLKNSIVKSGDKQILFKYNQWVSLKKEISNLHEVSAKFIDENVTLLEDKANLIEKELISNSKEFVSFYKDQNIKWQQVQKKLKANQIAIEFVNFEYYDNKATEENYYCALILKPDKQYPKMIYLFKEKELEKLLSKNLNNDREGIDYLYGKKSDIKTELYDLIWKPIENQIKGYKNVFFSPSGLLNKITFSSLYTGDMFLCNSINLNRLNSTANLNSKKLKLDSINKVTLFGGIDYGKDSDKWEDLKSTKVEVKEITNILKSNNIETVLFTGKNASEENFKTHTSKSNIIHVATHGSFESDLRVRFQKIEIKEVIFENAIRGNYSYSGKNKSSLLRSKLIFSDANNFKVVKNNNGELTAMEIAQLDLKNTKLVVLSACETGVGEIKGSDGVYGLQRSFKMAGVKNIIMSLWKVPDKETKEFMIKFYENLFLEKDLRKAFQKTQKEMSEMYDPYYWSSFVLVE